MYKDVLLDHYRNPHNFGRLKKKTSDALLYNPLCGDKIHMDVLIKDGVVEDISFTGEGCVISTASASLLTDYVKKKKISELNTLDRKAMLDLIGIEVSAGRIKCLMLSHEALQKAIKNEEKN